MKLSVLPFLLFSIGVYAQQIGEFTSLSPGAQTTDFIIPSTHRFQKIIEAGDPLTEGGTLLNKNDFSGFVPISGSSELGYLSINAEAIPGGVAILDINYNNTSRLWETTKSEAVDFSGVFATVANCSGTVTPWNTIISCEEWTSIDLQNDPRFPFEGSRDLNNDGYDDLGWAIEIDPATKTVIDQPGGLNGADKLWAMGNFKHENAAIHSNERTVYQGVDSSLGYLYKFVANNAQNLSSGNLYVYRGTKNGSGNWIQLNNTTQSEQNSTIQQSTAVGATVFNGIEDVEIGPNGMVYFAVKGEGQVYRFQDSDPISGKTVPLMETYVGDATYSIVHENGTSNVPWGGGNDNLAFDNQGNLWVFQDANDLQNYIWVVENDHSQSNPKVKIFGRTPFGSEATGITFSPDNRFLFMSIQHPNGNNSSSTQIDAAGNSIGFNKGITLVISLNVPVNQTWYLDADGDGFATLATVSSPTNPGAGYTTTILPTTDCDDTDETINPDTIWYLDADGDGFADPVTVMNCQNPGVGYSKTMVPTTDCDDNDVLVNASSTWYLDSDGDGFAVSAMESCQSPGIGYINEELPLTDCDDNDVLVNASSTWYLDADGDGFAISSVESCQSPEIGYTNEELPLTDCDDNDALVNASSTWYLDSDGDGFAVSAMESCQSPGIGYTNEELPLTDCDDNDVLVNASSTWYLDSDGDGFAVSAMESCHSPGIGYSKTMVPTTDCNDDDATVNAISTWYLDSDGDGFAVSAMESCQSPGIGYINEELPLTDCDDNDVLVNASSTWYLDSDGDGFAVSTLESCQSPGVGYTNEVLPITDCDDNDSLINSISIWYLDTDGDGFAITSLESCRNPGAGYTSEVLPTSDCDDSDALIATETLWYLDANADGFADEVPITSCQSPGAGYTQNELPLRSLLTSDGSIFYPNPTEGEVLVLLDKSYEELLVRVLTSNGRLVFDKKINDTDVISVDLGGQQSGIYFLQIISEENRIGFHKVVVN